MGTAASTGENHYQCEGSGSSLCVQHKYMQQSVQCFVLFLIRGGGGRWGGGGG